MAAEKGLGTEETAREMRYAFLEEERSRLGCAFILTAHHADDNAETMLLNLLRGTGLRGLTGIPPVRDCIARPFLRIPREELAAYAAKHGIPHVEDGTNALDDAARNVLRHKVMPVLRELNPRAAEHMARTAQLLAEDEAALAAEAEAVLAQVRLEESCAACQTRDLLRVKQAVRSRCVRKMLAHASGHEKDLTAVHVDAVCDLLEGQKAREVSLPYDMCARMDGGVLTIQKQKPVPEEIPLRVGMEIVFGAWCIELSAERGGQGIALPPDADLRVTTWQKDDRMTLPGSRGARSFKRICVDCGISPTQRDLLPVLRVNGKAAAVPGVGMDLEFTPQTDAVVFLTFKNTEERIR
jgi:tRNA(Ile)-lysidine synthase